MKVNLDGEQVGAEPADRGRMARPAESIEPLLRIVVRNDPGLAGAPAPAQPQPHPGISAQVGDVAGVAALFGHDPGCVVLDVDPDDRPPPLAGAAADRLNQRVSRNEAKMNAELYGWVEQVLLQQSHPPAPGGVFRGHGLVSITTLPVVADAEAKTATSHFQDHIRSLSWP
jgi:hypothetical protein